MTDEVSVRTCQHLQQKNSQLKLFQIKSGHTMYIDVDVLKNLATPSPDHNPDGDTSNLLTLHF